MNKAQFTEWLRFKEDRGKACEEACDWFNEQPGTLKQIYERCDDFGWLNWLYEELGLRDAYRAVDEPAHEAYHTAERSLHEVYLAGLRSLPSGNCTTMPVSIHVSGVAEGYLYTRDYVAAAVGNRAAARQSHWEIYVAARQPHWNAYSAARKLPWQMVRKALKVIGEN